MELVWIAVRCARDGSNKCILLEFLVHRLRVQLSFTYRPSCGMLKEEMVHASQDREDREAEGGDGQRNAGEEENRPSARDDEGKKDGKSKRKLA